MKYCITTVPCSRSVSAPGDRAWIRAYENEDQYIYDKSREKSINFIKITKKEFIFMKELLPNPRPLDYVGIKECYSLEI